MSRTFELVCHEAKAMLWVGQGSNNPDSLMTTFYSGDPAAMRRLGAFLAQTAGKHLVLMDTEAASYLDDYRQLDEEPHDEHEPSMVEDQLTCLLEGFGASEDHEDCIQFFKGSGFSEKTAKALVKAIALHHFLETLDEVKSCFGAAEFEGLSAALAETTDTRLKDLVERRLMHALYAADKALAVIKGD